MIIEVGKPWYHGSYTIVDKPDLAKCLEGKDFGRGFYLTTDDNQAKRFVKSSIGKAIKNGAENVEEDRGYLNVYNHSELEGIEVFEFPTADRDWLHCVAAHRKSNLLKDEVKKWEAYDIIAGKIANDATNQVITAYINGLYGAVGSDTADETAIRLLMPEKLTDQICIRTEKALERLIFLESIEHTI
ncbi:DUF3990 domain-containing protein [Butyrivibrio sp. WCD2001]|uniref:DUF3990 domain-containing protein n=1 Tax=Butyrivibrio sp. WCD2001 TaxID=1280681 RepID=UPI000402DC3E|nr:DUF3990 domain-containing protein [Butyrivibrio sp. WCD2001]